MLFQHVRMAGMATAVLLLGWQASIAAEAPCNNPTALGVSRVQEIDTSTGPIFGDIQYIHAPSFLADKEVVLTFDDGPFPETTPAILQALAEQCTKATFFYVGRMALKNPDILAEVDAAGETIGTHTWSHADLRKLPGPRALAEIERGVSLLQARLGHPIAPFFRFPYLSDPKAEIHYLGGRGFGVFSADVDSWDSHGLTPTAHIINYVMTRLKQQGRGIVLMHDIKHTTAAALPEILRQLKAGGYKIVHLVPKTPATSLAPYDEWARQTIETNDAAGLVAANKSAAVATKVAANQLDRKKLLVVAAAGGLASLTAAKLVSTAVRASSIAGLSGLDPGAFAGVVPPPSTGVVQARHADGTAPASPGLPMPAATPAAWAKAVVAVLDAVPAQAAPAAATATSQTTRLLAARTDAPTDAPLRLETAVAVKSGAGVAGVAVQAAPATTPALVLVRADSMTAFVPDGAEPGVPTAPAASSLAPSGVAGAGRRLVVASLDNWPAAKAPGDAIANTATPVAFPPTAGHTAPTQLAAGQAAEAAPQPAAPVAARTPVRAGQAIAASMNSSASPPPAGMAVAAKFAVALSAMSPTQAAPAAGAVPDGAKPGVPTASGAAPSLPPPPLPVVAAKFAAEGVDTSPQQSPSTAVAPGASSRMAMASTGRSAAQLLPAEVSATAKFAAKGADASPQHLAAVAPALRIASAAQPGTPAQAVPPGNVLAAAMPASGSIVAALALSSPTATSQRPAAAGLTIATNDALVFATPPAGTPAPAKAPRLPLDTEIRTTSAETDPAVETTGTDDPKAAARAKAKAAAKAARLLRRKQLGSTQVASAVATNPVPSDDPLLAPGQSSTGLPRAGTAAALLASSDAAPAPIKKRPLRALRVAKSGTAWLASLVESTGLFDSPTAKK